MPENIHLVQATIENNPRMSARRNPTGLSRSALRRILKNLKMVPFKVKTQQELLPLDFERIRIFCEWFKTLFMEMKPRFTWTGELTAKIRGIKHWLTRIQKKRNSMFLQQRKSFSMGRIVGKWDSDRTSFLRRQPKWGKVLSNVGTTNHSTD